VSTEGRSRSRAGAGEAYSREDLVRALCHDVGNLLTAVRLGAHLHSAEIDETERLSLPEEIEDLVARAGALLAHVRPLLAGPEVAAVPVSPAEVLMALSRALKDRKGGGAALSIARGRSLPDVRVDPDALYHLLLTLVLGSLEAADPDGQVRVSAKHQGRRVILSVIDNGRQVDLEEIRWGTPPRGRELAIRVADAVLRSMGGRAAAELQRRGTRIDLFLPATTIKKR
jgi:C4-dicarboxylate-specific signal transduction histidine kinase